MIADGAYFSRITDKRFKVNRIIVRFFTDFDDISRSDYAAAAYILADCCEKFPDYNKLSRYLSDLYDASLESGTTMVRWDKRCTMISASILDNRYVLDSEDAESLMCGLIRECLLFPKKENGVFDSSVTALMKAELIDAIDSVINDKSAYALRNGNAVAFKGEPQEFPINGSHEEAEKVTPKSAYAAYKKILETGHIEIICAGSSEFSAAERIFTGMIREMDRHDICSLESRPSPLKAEPVYVRDKFEMSQAILRMYFKAKTSITNRAANMLFSLILGGMTTSRFFMNIREKQSLCYYCSSTADRQKQVLFVVSGVEPCNIEKTRDAVFKEIRDIQENGVTEEELTAAKLEVKNQVAVLYDHASALGTWYLNQITDEKLQTPEEFLEDVRKVDRNAVQAIAQIYALDTVYVLSGGDDDA